MDEVLFGSALGMAAFLAAIGVVLCIAAVLHWGHHREQGLIPYIFYPAILVVMLDIVLSGRNLYLPSNLAFIAVAKHPLVAWGGRLTSLFLLFAATERIAKRFLSLGPKPYAPTALIAAFWVFFLTNVVSSAVLGTHPSFSHEYLYTVLGGYAALLVTQQDGDTAIRSTRNALFVFLILSAVCMAWRPEMVLSRNYEGLMPGMNMRYAGLSSHPNTFGPVVTVFLLCLWSRPYSARWVNQLGWTIGCASLVLAQSKTSWIAFVLCAACLAYFRHGDGLAQRLFDFRRPLLPATLLLLAMLTTCAVGVAFMFGGVGERVGAFFDTRMGVDLLSLTRRNQIWEIAIQEWRNNPLFGYGLTIWNDDYRAQIGNLAAFHAHNQFYQSLSNAGIVGAAGLVIYAVTLFWFALKTVKASKGLSLALFMLIFIRSISEVPLAMRGYGTEQLTHLLLLMVVASQFAPSSIERVGAKTPARHRLVLS